MGKPKLELHFKENESLHGWEQVNPGLFDSLQFTLETDDDGNPQHLIAWIGLSPEDELDPNDILNDCLNMGSYLIDVARALKHLDDHGIIYSADTNGMDDGQYTVDITINLDEPPNTERITITLEP